jgi:hypothetical protein
MGILYLMQYDCKFVRKLDINLAISLAYPGA